MGLFKKSLPEDIDVTDERDQSGSIIEDVTAPTEVDWALVEIVNGVTTLEKNPNQLTVGDLDDIYKVILRLNNIIDKVEKPF